MSNVQRSRELATTIRALKAEIEHLEAKVKEAHAELTTLFPQIAEGYSPPYFSVSITHRVNLKQEDARFYYMQHPDHRFLFSLSIKKEDFERLGSPGFATLKASAPTIKVDTKALDRLSQAA